MSDSLAKNLQDIRNFIEVQEAGLPDTLPMHLQGEITLTIGIPSTYTGRWHLKSKIHAGFDTHCSKTAQRVCYWLTGVDRYLPDILKEGEPLASWTFNEESCRDQMQVLVFDIIEHKFVVVAGSDGNEFLLLQSNLENPKFSLAEWLNGTVHQDCDISAIMTKDDFKHMVHVLQCPKWPSRRQLHDLFGAPYPTYNPKNATVTQLPIGDAFN